jgi:hypothetical protein
MDLIKVKAVGSMGDPKAADARVEHPAALARWQPAGIQLGSALVTSGVPWDPRWTRTVTDVHRTGQGPPLFANLRQIAMNPHVSGDTSMPRQGSFQKMISPSYKRRTP